jgi:hypothetical protein
VNISDGALVIGLNAADSNGTDSGDGIVLGEIGSGRPVIART